MAQWLLDTKEKRNEQAEIRFRASHNVQKNIYIGINVASRVKLSIDGKTSGVIRDRDLCAISRLPRSRISDWHYPFPFRWHSKSSGTPAVFHSPDGNLVRTAPDRVGYRARFTITRTEESNVSERFMHLAWRSLAASHMATHRDVAYPVARTAYSRGKTQFPPIVSSAKSSLWIRASFFARVVNILSRDNASTSRRILNLFAGNSWNCTPNKCQCSRKHVMSHKRNNPSEIVIPFYSKRKLKRARTQESLSTILQHTILFHALSCIHFFFRYIVVWIHCQCRHRLDTHIIHIFYRIKNSSQRNCAIDNMCLFRFTHILLDRFD